jgi:type II secretory pathway pseudopilin PulG
MKKMKFLVMAILAVVLIGAFVQSTNEKARESQASEKPLTAQAVNALTETARAEYKADFWRLDAKDKDSLPINFRTSADPVKADGKRNPDLTGLPELAVSGSGQMSKQQMAALVGRLKQNAEGPIYIVDLRQESHGFLNGEAASLYGKRNWGNIGKSTDDILSEEKEALKNVKNENADVYELTKDKKQNKETNLSLLVKSAQTEQEVANDAGARYFRITSTDHIWTDAKNVDRFLAFYKTLPQNAWLHFHCEAGKGRTTTYMILYDILRNGAGVSLEDIADRQYLMGGEDVLAEHKEKDSEKKAEDWKQNFEIERAAMIRLFYQYVAENPQLDVTWSEWLQKHEAAK